MTDYQDQGGPAFPSNRTGANGRTINLCGGMTLRDWFAGQAMMGMVQPEIGADKWPDAKNAAVNAYKYADAMLAARKPTK